MDESKLNRDALRRKLREKIRNKRGESDNVQLARRLKTDPATTMLQLGIDDADLIKNAKGLVKNPMDFLQHAMRLESDKQVSNIAESDEEEAPPNF